MDKITNNITYPAGSINFQLHWAMLMFQTSKRSQRLPPIIWWSIFGHAVKQMWLCVFVFLKVGQWEWKSDSVPDSLIYVWKSKYQTSLCCLTCKHYLPGRESILIREERRTGAETRQRLNMMCFSFTYFKTNVVNQMFVERLWSKIKKSHSVGIVMHVFNLSTKQAEAGRFQEQPCLHSEFQASQANTDCISK